METVDWKTQIPPDSRQKIVTKIMETLKKHLPFSGPAGMHELRRIAASFEEKIFSGATSQTDYLRKISTKMLTMDTTSQNAAGSSSIPATNNNLPGGDPVKEEPADTTNWRTHLSSDSREKNAKKIMETLKKHVPNSEEEEVEELKRIGVSFEKLIFKTATDQVDYIGKISFKMEMMKESELRPKRRKRKRNF